MDLALRLKLGSCFYPGTNGIGAPSEPPPWSPDAPFYDVRVDKYGQRVVGYLGPGGWLWNGVPFPEPAGRPEARADGVLVDRVEWPDVAPY